MQKVTLLHMWKAKAHISLHLRESYIFMENNFDMKIFTSLLIGGYSE